jgi:hypothetical protein
MPTTQLSSTSGSHLVASRPLTLLAGQNKPRQHTELTGLFWLRGLATTFTEHEPS